MKSKAARKFFKERKGAVYNEAKKKQAFAYEYLSLPKLPDGTYYFHLMPGREDKCPNGEMYVSTAKLPEPGAKESWRGQNVLLGECTGNACYLTELTQALNKNDRLKRLPKIVRDRLVEALSPFDQMWYVSAWLMDIVNKEIPAPTPDDLDAVKVQKSYVSNPKKEMEQGILMKVWQKSVVEDIASCLEEFPEIKDPRNGRCLKLFKKGKKYRVSVSKKRAVKNDKLYKDQYKDVFKELERITFGYEDQKIMFAERMGKQVLMALAKIGVNLDDPLVGSSKGKSAMDELDSSPDPDWDEDKEEEIPFDSDDDEDDEEDFDDDEDFEESDDDDEDWD